MRKYSFFLVSGFLIVEVLFGSQITAKVEIKEKKLKQFQPIAVARLPLPENGYVYVTDKNGLKVQSIRISSGEKNQRDGIFFKTTGEDVYFVHWLSEERKSETAIFEIPEGKVIIDDYINPSARTSGFWFWVSNPVLSGRFSHTGRSQQNINSHYTSIIPGQPAKGKDILFQYVFFEKNNAPSEIMIEIQIHRRTSYYFSWGSDLIKWKALDKIRMGELPTQDGWSGLIIPVEKMGKDVEITGIGFYNAGGKVFWDYTTIGNPPLETRVIEWKKKDKKVSAFFEREIFGPFAFKNNEFYIGAFDASASTGAETFIWNADNTIGTGKYLRSVFSGKSPAKVSLFCSNRMKETDVFSETILFQQKQQPEDVKLFLKILPHRNLVKTGEKIFIPVQTGSLMSGIVPVELSTADETINFKLLPGRENAFNKNLFFTINQPGLQTIELKIGTFTIVQKKIKFLQIDELEEKNVDGPYLIDSDDTEIIAYIPDYRFSGSLADVQKLLMVGDIPDGFIETLKEQYFSGTQIIWLKYPESKGYHALMNILWLKRQIEGQNYDAVILFPSLDTLIRRTPVDEYIAALDACVWFLTKCTKKIICATPFPSAPLAKIFEPYANFTRQLCKERNILCLDLYSAYTRIDGWTEFFSAGKGIYKNFPSKDGLKLLVDEIVKMMNKTS
ncbi:MAG: hypothetical protein NC913_05890 [Candidatus Omnitrophica bacterium]|nr:hypothetical protein [Candidatus Omnitrophota bacterium]